MQPNQRTRGGSTFSWSFFVLIAAISLLAIQVEAASNVVIWDTGAPISDDSGIADRGNWKKVPSDLFTLEADPFKASSDPGYYGREYAFKGDAVVENGSLVAVFWSAKGRAVLYSKPENTSSTNAFPGHKIGEVMPQGKASGIGHCEILRNGGDEAVLKVLFSGGGAESVILFSFDKTPIVGITPDKEVKGICVACPIEYGIVPGFVGDDLIFGRAGAPDTMAIPTENIFLGLLKGESSTLVMTWPGGRQQMRLNLASESIDFDNDGQSVYLAASTAPGIWHREESNIAYLEKDVVSAWKRPFPAKWQTQLNESGVKITFPFKEAKGQIWRGVPGMYNYPVWFEGSDAHYFLSKKVPPKGESLIYFLEGQNTPSSIMTPVEVMKATLGRQVSDSIADVAGRKLRTHHRRGATGVRRACTCGCTEFIQAIFESGQEVAKKADIDDAIGDMIYFIQQHVERIEEYRRFADDMTKFLQAKGNADPDLKPYLENLEQIVQQIPQECTVQQENMKSLDYAAELKNKTMALTAKKDPQNLPTYLNLLKDWRGMGGAQDYVVAQCNAITRKLFQEAGYCCVEQPKALEAAKEIRNRCKRCLRNPDGYEMWPSS